MYGDFRISLLGLLCLVLPPLAAGPVYSWVDPAGITHFSELPPPPGTGGMMQLELPPYPPVTRPQDDYWSVINQAARMQAQRLERERLEAERRHAEAEAWRAQAEAQAAGESAAPYPIPAYIPWYPAPVWHPHPRHHQHGYRDHDRPDPRAQQPRKWPATRLHRPPAMTLPGNR